MPRGFFFDNTRCTGCRTCVLACKDYHSHTVDLAFRMVLDYEGGSWSYAKNGDLTQNSYAYHISLACNHCNNPACVNICPTSAMHKDDLGLVWPDTEKCIGCGYCTMACPYHAPHIDQDLKQSSKCDGCRARIEEGKNPICVDACPLRALDFGEASELTEKYPDCPSCIMPLPDADATSPNLLILPSPAALQAEEIPGSIVNRDEVGLA